MAISLCYKNNLKVYIFFLKLAFSIYIGISFNMYYQSRHWEFLIFHHQFHIYILDSSFICTVLKIMSSGSDRQGVDITCSHSKKYFCQTCAYPNGKMLLSKNLAIRVDTNSTYWATQWAAVKIWYGSIMDPSQNCRPLFINMTTQGHAFFWASLPAN